MSVRPNRLLSLVPSTLGQYFVFSQPVLCRPHTQIRMIILFDGVRMSIPNWKPSPNRALIEFSRIAFPTIVLPRNDRADFAQEERLGLLCWTMILAICVLVEVSKYLDIHTWSLIFSFIFSVIFSSLFFHLLSSFSSFLWEVCKKTTFSAYDVRIRRMKHILAGDTNIILLHAGNWTCVEGKKGRHCRTDLRGRQRHT